MEPTKNRAHDAASYPFQRGEPILVDANVWLLLHPLVPRVSKRQKIYTATFKNLLKAGATPIIDVLILSEYINRCLRNEFNVWSKKHAGTSYKQYRSSPEGLRAAGNVAAEVRRILKEASLRDTRIQGVKIENILGSIESGALDFNDGVLIGSCRQQGWKFLTDDGDMSTGGIELLTANLDLLERCTAA
jgi:hypothetical protein